MRGVEIDLYEMLRTDTLRDRQTALVVVDRICNLPVSSPVRIDFARIVFASRSFCHELLTQLKDRKNVSFKNMNREVQRMMLVARTKPNVNSNIKMKVTLIH